MAVLAATFYGEPSLWIVLTDGAEPKKKRGRSAKPCLVVQFHPAPPLLCELTQTAAAKVTTAMRATRFTYYKQDGFEVWGKQYQDAAGAVTWRLRVFAEQDRRIETYEDVTVDPPEGMRTGESKAMRDALAAWLAPTPTPGNDEQDADAHIDAPRTQQAMAVVEPAPLPEEELRLNEEERKSLSPRARAYIEHLEQEVSGRKH